MSGIGSGVRELRVREDTGAYRLIYVAKLEETLFVLHCFKKTSQAASRKDISLAKARYRDLIRGEKR